MASHLLVDTMRIARPAGVIEVVNEPTYSFGSADNVRSYPVERDLALGSRASSTHGVLLDGVPIAVFANGGGASGVHDHSAVFVNGLLYLAVGDCVVCMSVSPIDVKWSLQVDSATCFGIHYDQSHGAFISHGELEIARFSEAGAILWGSSGAEVFSEGFALRSDFIEAIDFDHRTYRFRYEDGLPFAAQH
jgi:hypothetical protein